MLCVQTSTSTKTFTQMSSHLNSSIMQSKSTLTMIAVLNSTINSTVEVIGNIDIHVHPLLLRHGYSYKDKLIDKVFINNSSNILESIKK